MFLHLFAESGNGLASEDKKILLERYGYDADADEYFSQSSPKVQFFSLFSNFYACKMKILCHIVCLSESFVRVLNLAVCFLVLLNATV